MIQKVKSAEEVKRFHAKDEVYYLDQLGYARKSEIAEVRIKVINKDSFHGTMNVEVSYFIDGQTKEFHDELFPTLQALLEHITQYINPKRDE